MIRLLACVQKRRGISPGQRFRLEDFCLFQSPRLPEVLDTRGRNAQESDLMLRDLARRGTDVALARESRLRFPGKTRTIARLANAVTVGNGYLATWARQHDDHVHVVPTSIDLDAYDVQPEPDDETPFVLGWIAAAPFASLVRTMTTAQPVARAAPSSGTGDRRARGT